MQDPAQDPTQPSRFVLARASLGLASVAVSTALSMPRRVVESAVRLPAGIVGAGARTYLHVIHTVNELAVQGDAVIGAILPPKDENPEWATFDEDVELAEELRDADSDDGIDGFDAAETEADV